MMCSVDTATPEEQAEAKEEDTTATATSTGETVSDGGSEKDGDKKTSEEEGSDFASFKNVTGGNSKTIVVVARCACRHCTRLP